MGEELRQVVIECHVISDNRTHGRGHGLFDIARGQMRLQPVLRFLGLHKYKTGRTAIGAGRAHFGDVHQFFQNGIGDIIWRPCIVAARVEKQLVKRGFGYAVIHGRNK